MNPQVLIDKANELLSKADDMLDHEEATPKRAGVTTDLVIIMDRSGSMEGIARDMQGGLERFLREQAELNGDAVATIVQFDTEYEVLAKRQPIDMVDAPKLKPRGGTALLDAVGRTLCDLVRTVPKQNLVVCMIITDGQENSSHEFKRDQVRSLIQKCQSKRDWQFIYLGADPSTFAEAQSMGFQMANVSEYKPTSKNVDQLFACASSNVRNYRGTAQSSALNWSDDQRVSLSE